MQDSLLAIRIAVSSEACCYADVWIIGTAQTSVARGRDYAQTSKPNRTTKVLAAFDVEPDGDDKEQI
jgi:hypothetical protein